MFSHRMWPTSGSYKPHTCILHALHLVIVILWKYTCWYLSKYLLIYLLTFLLTYLITYFLTYLLNYLLTPWCRVFLEKLTGLQLVKKFPAFHGTRRFITALTSVRHLALSWASPIQSICPRPTSWRSVLILSTHLRLGLPSGLLPSGFPTKTLYTSSPHPYLPHAQPISFFSILSPAQYWVRSTKHLLHVSKIYTILVTLFSIRVICV